MAKRLSDIDIANRIGQVFGDLTIVSIDNSILGNHKPCTCICICGGTRITRYSSLVSGATKSCGCANSKPKTHGQSNHPLFKIWRGMISRCTKPQAANYPLYGGRGITVCDEWLNDINIFIADMGERPSKDHSVERRNNELGYSKDNCYWATRKEQCNNTRSNVFIEYNGKNQTVTQWANELDIDPETLRQRLKNNWSVEKALTTPLGTRLLDKSIEWLD